jgi:hypothetical protein
MGVNSAEGEFLARFFARSNECSVGKAPVVAVVVGNFYAMLGGKPLECSLGIDGLGRGEIQRHQINVLQPWKMVNEDDGIFVACLGEAPLGLAEEAWLGWLKVIDGDALPRLGGGKDRMLGFLLFALPRDFPHGSEKTTCAPGGANLGKLLRNFAVER